jgi:hypothetical protein
MALEELMFVARDIHAQFPGAIVSWETKTKPYMLTAEWQGNRFRAFIEPAHISPGNPDYQQVLTGILDQLRAVAKPPGITR